MEMEMSTFGPYRVIKCKCGWPTCESYQVRGVAPEAKFTKEQAEAVALALTNEERNRDQDH